MFEIMIDRQYKIDSFLTEISPFKVVSLFGINYSY